MSIRLADRLVAARQRLIVGRGSELAAFQAALSEDELPFYLLYVYGPGGVGKTTLLNEFAQVCAQVQNPAYFVDARNVDPSPDAFLSSLQLAMGLDPHESPLAHLSLLPGHPVVLIDTYETLRPLDEWLQKIFFPQLPENVLIVLAGRQPPSPAWRSDPGWNTLIRVLPLRNLSPGESRSYLEKRNVPSEEHQAVLDFTHGHPLALSLVADVFAQRPGVHFQPDETPDIVKTLLEQFVQKVPSPAHRTALEACALVRVTTEALLGEMLGLEGQSEIASQSVGELFEWLRGLSFIESGRSGLFPHDLARESLVADLRWRNPDWYAELHRRARNYFNKRLGQASVAVQQLILLDYVFLHRDNPVVRPFFEWLASGSFPGDSFRENDRQALIEMVSQHEGSTSALIAGHWLARQPHNIFVLRDSESHPAGFLALISLADASQEDQEIDPAVKQALDFLRGHAPLRPGEKATHFRFWMARDTYQDISPVQSLIVINIVRHYLTTPGLAYTFFPVADPVFWAPLAAYANITRLPAVDYELEGRSFGVFGHDWRAEPPQTWLALLAEREMGASPLPEQPRQASQPLLVLSQADFAAAVQEALRSFSRPDGLHGNPLLRSRLVMEKARPEAGDTERSQRLRDLLKQAMEMLRSSPRDAKLYRTLYHTYVQPAPTQEAASEILDLPFSTYRRHLKAGVARLVEILWQREVIGGENEQKLSTF